MIDTNGDRIGLGIEAESLLARLRPQFAKVRDRTIQSLVTHFKTETLTHNLALQGVAMLAALDELEQELSHRVRLGRKDAEESQK